MWVILFYVLEGSGAHCCTTNANFVLVHVTSYFLPSFTCFFFPVCTACWSRKGPSCLGRPSHRERESWWQSLTIVKLNVEATSSNSRWSHSSHLILFMGIVYELKCYFLISFFTFTNATLFSDLKCIFY